MTTKRDRLDKTVATATARLGDPGSYHGPDYDTWSAMVISAALVEVADEIRLLRKHLEDRAE